MLRSSSFYNRFPKAINTALYMAVFAVGLFACKEYYQPKAWQSPVIAQLNEKTLHQESIKNLIPEGASPEDSAQIAQSFVQEWLKKQLLLNQAELNLTEKQKDVQQQLEEYRSKLLIYKYEQKFIEQKLDTAIADSLILAFYLQHPMEFHLPQNLFKGLYIKVLKSDTTIKKVRKLYRSNKEDDLMELENYCYQFAIKFDYFNNNWMYLTNFLQEYPFSVENQESFLKGNSHIENSDSVYQYFLRIDDFRLKGDTIPLPLAKDKIKKIMLTKRKKQLLNSLENDLYNEAANKNNLIIY